MVKMVKHGKIAPEKSAPQCPFECGGGGVIAIWAMPKQRWRQIERVLPYVCTCRTPFSYLITIGWFFIECSETWHYSLPVFEPGAFLFVVGGWWRGLIFDREPSERNDLFCRGEKCPLTIVHRTWRCHKCNRQESFVHTNLHNRVYT